MVVAVSLALLSMAALAVSSSAQAAKECESCRPWWHLNVGSRPTNLVPESKGEVILTAANLGTAAADGASDPIVLTDTLPAHMKALSVEAIAGEIPGLVGNRGPVACKVQGQIVTCAFEGLYEREKGDVVGKTLPSYDQIEVRVKVESLSGAESGELNQFAVSGGGAAPAQLSRPIVLSEESTLFGLESYELGYEDAEGDAITQAGSHPFQQTVVVNVNQQAATVSKEGKYNDHVPALAKDVHTQLPAGLVGNPVPLPRCTLAQFLDVPAAGEDVCPADTAVGVAMITVEEPSQVGLTTFSVPIFNLEPTFGEPARFGFLLPATPIVIDTSIASAGPDPTYNIVASVTNISQTAALISSKVIFWGTPGDPRHNEARGWACQQQAREWAQQDIKLRESCQPSEEAHPPAFLRVPTSCAGPLQSIAEVDSWPEPQNLLTYQASPPPGTLDGCNQLLFAPRVSAQPSTDRASAPSGLDFNLDFTNEGLTNTNGTAESDMKNAVVTLPEGFTINPSAGVGLVGCTPADYARETLTSAAGEGCPNESKLGTVEVETPLLTQKIHGSLYIAQPYENPFPEPQAGHPNGTLVALYVVLRNPETGILIKLAGKVTPNPVTGQLTTSFADNPQFPFTHFNFQFREGQQAPLISPPLCGTYTTTAQLTPWSEPLAAQTETSSFTITKGYDGGACPSGGAPPFKPGIVSGTQNNNAGAFSPFYLHLTRTDGEQEISGFSTNLPSGLTGDLTGIPFCPEASIEAARHKTGAQEEANPSCPAASQIGRSLVGTGVGAVLAYVPGKIYLAGPFHGAPFSIVSITSATVGPFDLGTVVLRFGLAIDPNTAKVSVSPTSSEPIPTIIDGIVTHVRDIRVYIDRPNFILDPTSCNPMNISSTLSSPAGAAATVSSPFQGSNCQALKFTPKFVVSTSGKTSRTAGASLHVQLTYPSNSLGNDTNIAKVKVDLPRQLPSRLSTLQKACTDAQFETNPAGCPAESRVGQAKAVTPLIPVPLEGPAYFVSHGGAKFPELIIVLQGYGLTIDLHGETFINKAGITSSTFEAVPDEPIGNFELTLPEGPYSALAANGDLCKSTLAMPTSFVAQNGVEIHESTSIGVTGCKSSVNIVRHSAKGATVTIAASVPSAGKLVVSGSGLSRATKRTGKAGTLSFSLKLSGRERALLKSHPGRKLAVVVKLQFTPTHGHKLAAGVTVNVG
jgi:hypothetical protein